MKGWVSLGRPYGLSSAGHPSLPGRCFASRDCIAFAEPPTHVEYLWDSHGHAAGPTLLNAALPLSGPPDLLELLSKYVARERDKERGTLGAVQILCPPPLLFRRYDLD